MAKVTLPRFPATFRARPAAAIRFPPTSPAPVLRRLKLQEFLSRGISSGRGRTPHHRSPQSPQRRILRARAALTFADGQTPGVQSIQHPRASRSQCCSSIPARRASLSPLLSPCRPPFRSWPRAWLLEVGEAGCGMDSPPSRAERLSSPPAPPTVGRCGRCQKPLPMFFI